MKSLQLFLGTLFISFLAINSSHAQFNPYNDANAMVTVGAGATFDRGIPFFARFEKAIVDNVTIGGQLSYQSYKRDRWYGHRRYTAIGVTGRGSYHFNELLGLDSKWDVYAGVAAGFYIENSKQVTNDGRTIDDDFYDSYDGFDLNLHTGGRYFFKDNLALNAELGGGSIGYWGLRVGVTWLLN